MKKALVISLILISIFSTLSLSSYALYESYPYNDGTQVKQYSSTDNILDIAATDNSIIINKAGTLDELNSGDFSHKKYGQVSGLENIDYVGNGFGLIGTDNETKRIYLDCMNTSSRYLPYPTDNNITKITAINGKVKMEIGTSGNPQPFLYVDINIPGKYYGSRILEYKFYTHFNRWAFVKEYSTSYTERGDFAYIPDGNTVKIVGITGYYQPVFFAKSEINTASTTETGLPGGYNCHGYVPWGGSSVAVINPQKLAFGNGYYYAIVKQQYTIDIVRIASGYLKF